MTDYNTECPICGKALFVGMGMNEHVNLCMDEKAKMQSDDDEDEDDDIAAPMKQCQQVAPLSRDQMIECATKLMTLQQGSDNFNNMLHQFGALGFNKSNLTKVLQIEKEQIYKKKQSNHNHNESVLSPIDEEDVDLNAKNRNGQGFDALDIDDDDL